MSFTVHCLAIVGKFHWSGVRDFNNSINILSKTGNKCKVGIGTGGVFFRLKIKSNINILKKLPGS
jgi:hypothetical protein